LVDCDVIAASGSTEQLK